MIDRTLVTSDKPKQLSMAWVLTLLESQEWQQFCAKRQPLLQLFCSIKFKSSDEVANLYQLFYDRVGQTIFSDYMTDFKCKLILQFVSNHVLADVAIPNTVTARRTQQLFGNISTEKLKEAQNWSIEKNIASFMLELLRSVSTFID